MTSCRQEDAVGDSGKTAFLILGAHRSGTSLVTRILNMLGLSLGRDLLGPHDCNVTGLWENAAIVALNEEILSETGSAWFDHGILDMDWNHAGGDRVVERIVDVIREQFDGTSHIAIKDPRICRLVPLYESALRRLGYGVRALIQYRSPLEVSLSLYRRDGLPVSLGAGLWIAHMLQVLRDTRGQDRLFVEYGDLLEAAEGQARRIEGWLTGYEQPIDPSLLARAVACIDPALKSGAGDDRMTPPVRADLLALAGELYGHLRCLRAGGHADLDVDEAIRRYTHVSGSTRWLQSPTVTVVHAGPDREEGVPSGALRDVIAGYAGLLTIMDGEETAAWNADMTAAALQGDMGLFYNRGARGEDASLVRGISLVAGRDLLLLRRAGWPEIGEILRHLREPRTDESVIVFGRASAPEGQGHAEHPAAAPLWSACLAVFVPRSRVGECDPWSCIHRPGDALPHLLDGFEVKVILLAPVRYHA